MVLFHCSVPLSMVLKSPWLTCWDAKLCCAAIPIRMFKRTTIRTAAVSTSAWGPWDSTLEEGDSVLIWNDRACRKKLGQEQIIGWRLISPSGPVGVFNFHVQSSLHYICPLLMPTYSTTLLTFPYLSFFFFFSFVLSIVPIEKILLYWHFWSMDNAGLAAHRCLLCGY